MDAAEILKNLNEIGQKLSDLHDTIMLQRDNIMASINTTDRQTDRQTE